MKKIVIAGASLALAAMPVVGVFAAAEEGNHMIDNITVTVPTSCSITNNNTDEDGEVADVVNNYAATIYNGQYQIIDADDTTGATTADNTIGVTCNSTATSGTATSWRLTAVGAGAAGHETELYNASGTAEKNVIPSAATPVTTAGGETSDWSFRVVIASPATAASGFTSNTFTQIPSTEKDIATGNGTAAEGTFTMDYGVYVSGTQEAGTYTGAVKYTLYNPAS